MRSQRIARKPRVPANNPCTVQMTDDYGHNIFEVSARCPWCVQATTDARSCDARRRSRSRWCLLHALATRSIPSLNHPVCATGVRRLPQDRCATPFPPTHPPTHPRAMGSLTRDRLPALPYSQIIPKSAQDLSYCRHDAHTHACALMYRCRHKLASMPRHALHITRPRVCVGRLPCTEPLQVAVLQKG